MGTLIFDCDPGIDDAIALGLFSGLLKKSQYSNFNVYIVATWGNVPQDKTLVNSIISKSIFEINCKIAKGESKPLKASPVHAKKIHGEDGLGGAAKKYITKTKIETEEIIDLKELIKILNDSKDKIHIIATGPLSSTAQIIQKLGDQLERIVWMGGSFFHDGNFTPYAEFNSYCDPDAVKVLFEFAKEKKCAEIVPLDATEKTQMETDKFLKLIEDQNYKAFIEDITKNTRLITLHDPLAVFTFFFPEHTKKFITVSHIDTKAFRGKISSIITPTGFLKVVYDFDREKFIESIRIAFKKG